MTASEWLLVLGMTAVTFGVRYPVLALVSRLSLPPTLLGAMRYIPPAVLAAIIAPALLMPDGQSVQISYTNSALVAGIISILIAWRTRNLLLTIGGGMAAYLLWRLLV